MEREIRKLISDLENFNFFWNNAEELIERYNRILETVQRLHPDNSILHDEVPYNYSGILIDHNKIVKDLLMKSRIILSSLKKDIEKSNNQSITINIASMNGDFSFENMISTIKNSNIGNREEIINYVTEFRKELNKTNPDKDKLRKIIDKVENISTGVMTGLLVEFAKRVFGL